MKRMSEMIMNESVVSTTLAWSAEVIPSKDGGYVGFMKEVPIAVQADSMDGITTKLANCLKECYEHDLLPIPHSMIKG